MGFFDFVRNAVPWRRARPLALPAPIGVDQAKTLGEQLASSVGSWTLPKRGSRELLAAYSELPWLHGCVRRRAEAFAAIEWVLYRPAKGKRGKRLRGLRSGRDVRHRAVEQYVDDKQLEQVIDHPLLDLFEEPIPDAPDIATIHGVAFWELLSTWMDLVGEAPIGKDGPRNDSGDRIGPPVELCPILPPWITAVPTVERPYYDVMMLNAGQRRVAPEDMVWVRHLDPNSPYTGRGIGTAIVLADELQTDEYMSAAARARFFNGSTPDWVMSLNTGGTNARPADEKAIRALTTDIENKHQGPDRAGRFHIVGGDFKLQQLGHTMVESQYIDGRKFLRDTCMQVFGVPPEVLGVLESSNKSTIAAASEHFARYSTVPMAERFRAALQVELVEEYGDDLILDYESPIPADLERATRIMVALPGAFKLDDIRDAAGLPKLDKGGDQLYKAPGAVPVKGDAPNAPAGDNGEPADGSAPDVQVLIPEGGDAVAGASAVQDTALNGAQVTSLLEVLDKVSQGILSIPGATAVIAGAFPAIPAATITEMLKGVQETPEPVPAPTTKEDANAVT